MALLTISEVAREVGIRPSAIRYYEQIGVLPHAQRVSGQRRYDSTVLNRLAVVRRARQAGFTLEEIRQLFCGFREGVPAGERWRVLSRRKLAELDAMMERLADMQALLRRLQENCRCTTLEQCGRAMMRKSRC